MWLAQYQDGIACTAAGAAAAAQPFGRSGQLQQALVLQFGGAGGGQNVAGSSSGGGSGGDGSLQETETAAAQRAANAKTLAASLVGAAGQLPKLDLFYLFRKYLLQHGGGLQIDTKVHPVFLSTLCPRSASQWPCCTFENKTLNTKRCAPSCCEPSASLALSSGSIGFPVVSCPSSRSRLLLHFPSYWDNCAEANMMRVVSTSTAGVAAAADDAAGAAAAGRRAEARVRAVDRCCVRGAAGGRVADGAARGL